MNLSWDDLRLVKAIADQGGLTRAAVLLSINHSTAFRRLAAIERALDARLFERHRSGYVPTRAGEAFVGVASRMEEEVARVTREVAGQAQAPEGELRVTAAAALVAGILMPLFSEFRSLHPQVRLEVISAEAVLNLSRRDADVAIRASIKPPPNLVGRRIAGIAWAVYGRAQDGDGLEGRLWVSPNESVGGEIFSRFVSERAPPERIVLRLNTVHGLAEAIEAGIGIGPLPCMDADARPALKRLTGIAPELEGSLWLLTHPELRHAPRVRAFMDFAGEWLSALRARSEGRLDAGRLSRWPAA